MQKLLGQRAFVVLAATLVSACESTATKSIAITLGDDGRQVTQGQSITISVEVIRTNHDGDVTLVATGLPTGVTASFAPATLSAANTTSTLTLTATNVAAPGAVTVTVEGTSAGVETATSTLALTVNVAGNYTVTASSATAFIHPGITTDVTFTLNRTGGFAQDVTFAATGLPNGVTASFNPASVSGSTSTLTFSASGAAIPGTSPVAVTSTTPGLIDHGVTITLTVRPPPSISLSIDFAPAQVEPGTSDVVSVTVNRSNFTGDVMLSATGLPSGVTVSFNPTTVPNGTLTSGVTFTADGSAAPGDYTVIIHANGTGISTASAPVGLQVRAPM